MTEKSAPLNQPSSLSREPQMDPFTPPRAPAQDIFQSPPSPPAELGENLLMRPHGASDLLDPVEPSFEEMQEKFGGAAPLPPQFSEGEMPGTPHTTVLDSPDPAMVPKSNSTPRGVAGGDRLSEIYIPPALEVSDADVERFLECIEGNYYYSERFEKGRISAVYRVRSAAEMDFQRSCLGLMMRRGDIKMITDYHDVMSRFNLFFQLDSLNGQKLTKPDLPPRPWREPQLNLEEQYWASEFSKFTEPLQFILHGMMVQFENKVYEIEKRVIDPKYSGHGGHS